MDVPIQNVKLTPLETCNFYTFTNTENLFWQEVIWEEESQYMVRKSFFSAADFFLCDPGKTDSYVRTSLTLPYQS